MLKRDAMKDFKRLSANEFNALTVQPFNASTNNHEIFRDRWIAI